MQNLFQPQFYCTFHKHFRSLLYCKSTGNTDSKLLEEDRCDICKEPLPKETYFKLQNKQLAYSIRFDKHIKAHEHFEQNLNIHQWYSFPKVYRSDLPAHVLKNASYLKVDFFYFCPICEQSLGDKYENVLNHLMTIHSDKEVEKWGYCKSFIEYILS